MAFTLRESPHETVGWMYNLPNFKILDIGERFREIHAGVVRSPTAVADAQRYRFVLVPGLFTGLYPGYMDGVAKHFKARGIDYIKADIDTSGSVFKNARAIARVLERINDKQVVLMGHSKGGVDSLAAILLYPQLQDRIRAFVCVQSPLGGSPIPADMLDGGFLSVCANILKPCDPRALADLSYATRGKFWCDFGASYPYDRIPTLTLATHSVDVKSSFMASMTNKLWEKYSALSDGMVCVKDGVVPGTAAVHLDGLDHGAPVFDFTAHSTYKPGTLFEALIAAVLELPQNYTTLAQPYVDPAVSEPPVGGVWLFTKPSYGGECIRLDRTKEISDASSWGIETVKSIKVGRGAAILLFDSFGFMGNVLMRVDRHNEVLMVTPKSIRIEVHPQ